MSRNQSADIVIIGGGVIGASTAYHLALMGASDVIVLERNAEPGQGSTSKATGGFRAQFGTAVNVKLSLLSREKLRRFPEEIGVDSGYRPYGYLFLARTQMELAKLMQARRIQKAAGLEEVELIDDDAISKLNPAIDNSGLVGGAFCSTDGFIVAMKILRGYQDAASRFGVQFEFGRQVTGFDLHNGRIHSVRTDGGEIACGNVVNAAGAWAGLIARQAKIEIPVQPLKRQVAATISTTLLPPEMPMTIFVEDGFHLRVRDGRVLLLWPDQPDASDPFDISVSQSWIQAVTSRAHERVPSLKEVPIDPSACWAGLYEMSPDKHALLGRMPELENFYLINGSSGHGVMHAPALGHLLAEMILTGEARSLDVRSLRPTRFAEGDLNPVSEIL